MVVPIRVISQEEFHALDKKRRTHKTKKRFNDWFKPGFLWLMPWYFDPFAPDAAMKRLEAQHALSEGKRTVLSPSYWQDWSLKRAPGCVVCPDGSHWMFDARSTNGNGWKITGPIERITAHPSIQTANYHGWLKEGEFSDDLEGRTYLT
jgi:hypothetical protein